MLLPALTKVLAARGVQFHQALFVPPDSQYGFLPAAGAQLSASAPLQDLSWQAGMQQLWERQGLGGGTHLHSKSAVLPPLPLPVLTTALGKAS